MVKPEWSWMFFNEEWNERDTDTDGGDEDFIDSVDVRLEVDEIEDFDDYEEYGKQDDDWWLGAGDKD